MTEHEHEVEPEELEEADGEALPDREAMSMVPLPDPLGGGLHTLPVEPPAES